MVRIPSEYQEVEYLESTGTQFISTDIDIQDGLTVDSTQTIAQGSDSYLFGGQGDSGTSSKTCFNGGWGVRIQGAYPSSYYAIGSVVLDNQTKYHIVSTHANNRRTCIVNGTEISNVAVAAFVATTGKCLCFGWNKYGTPSNLYKGKVYSVKVSKADTMLADYIPCYRKSDHEPGMYDLVSGTFYTNSGTGTFLVGNDVEYSTVSLLEARRKILLNTPHLTTASGSLATFQTDISAPLKDMKVHFSPVQASGTPSPDNVLPISGWDGVTVYNGQTVVASITFPQTIYGGYVDLVKGEVVETYGSDGQPITPQAYTLTPQTIKALKGINNIFSDTNGNVDVTYWTH